MLPRRRRPLGAVRPAISSPRELHPGILPADFAPLAGAALLLLSAAFPAAAQQIYVDSMWVSYPQTLATDPTTGAPRGCVRVGGTSLGQFWCPGPTQDLSAPTIAPGNQPAIIGNEPVSGSVANLSYVNSSGTQVNYSDTNGNISNNPRIDFDQNSNVGSFTNATGCYNNVAVAANLPPGNTVLNVCNQVVFLCMRVGYNNPNGSPIPIDSEEFEVFKFLGTGNPLDASSTPPLRTFFVDSPGLLPINSAGTLPESFPQLTIGQKATTLPIGAADRCNEVGLPSGCGMCVPWDGSYNFLGQLGKTNAIYGFRATVTTNVPGPNGNIQVTQTRAYPSGATLDSAGATVLQQPITVDVTNVHVVQASATLVGAITPLPAEPYNILYRLSKDATMYITITNTSDQGTLTNPIVRHILNGVPRPGEGKQLTGAQGETSGTLQNGDAWNGRGDNGDLEPPGVYLATLQAYSNGQFGADLSAAVTAQISLDPLFITDILTAPLTSQSTALATLTYTLSEPATVYINIYPSGTQFCRGLNDLNFTIPDSQPGADPNIPKDFQPALGSPTGGGCVAGGLAQGGPVPAVRTISEQKNFRTPVVSFWDGRDSNGRPVPDGNYVYLLYASLPSQNGVTYNLPPGNLTDKRIWTSIAKSGYITISRGFVTISQIGPATTIVGSSPSVAGLNPFIFSYSLSREAIVNLDVFDVTGQNLVRTLVKNEVRPGSFLNREIWPDGVGDNGLVVSSGIYMAQLTAADPFFPTKVTTTTALFPIDLFRITDVLPTQLLQGATAQLALNYQLSQTMNVSWNIYPSGTQILNSTTQWPPCSTLTPGVCAQTVNPNGQPIAPIISKFGTRPGRLLVTDFWDGRDTNGLFVPDGVYVFTLVAQSTTTPQYFASDRVMGTLSVVRGSDLFQSFTVNPHIPTLFNSSSTIPLPPYDIQYVLVRQSSMTITVLDTHVPPNEVRLVINGEVRDGGIVNDDFWDGKDDAGNFVRPGFYTVQAVATDLATEQTLTSGSTVQQTVTVDELRIFDVAVSPLQKDVGSAEIDYQVSEPMKVALKIYKPGTTFDPVGNPNPNESVSLVRRIVGVRPALTEIKEIWDGKDQKLTLLPDGNYIFRLVASTATAAIDTITGNVLPGAPLADDLVVADVPVLHGESADPVGDFEGNTFMYPNPVSGSQAIFNIFVPFQSNVSMKIFNLAGELVYETSFPDQAPTFNNPSGPIVFTWPRVNNSGKQVAAGVYYVLFREEETLGGTNVLQTVKKMLLQ